MNRIKGMCMGYSELSDQELQYKWHDGDDKAFRELCNRSKRQVFSFILRMVRDRELAEDLTQDTFLSAIKAADQFDQNRKFLSWLFGVAHKRTIDHFRRKKVMAAHKDKEEALMGSHFDNPDVATDNSHMRALLSDAIETLSPDQREVFLMREMGGVPFKEIAEIMDCTLNTALGRMRLALANIRKLFEERGIYGVQQMGE